MSKSKDIEFLRALDLRTECGEFVYATACVRADWLIDAPLSKRPGKLDAVLEQAAVLIGDRFTFYGGEADFAASRGRKPNASDIAQLAAFSDIMAKSEEHSAQEKTEQMAYLREHGLSSDPTNFEARDGGSMGLSDAFPLTQSGCHFQALGFGDWRMTLSFSLDLYEEKQVEVLALIEALFATGVPETGHFGFALNNDGVEDLNASHAVRTSVQKYPLLSPIQAGGLKWTNVFDGQKGLYPIGPWTFHDKALLAQLQVSEDAVRALEEHVYEVIESNHGFLIKLYPEPILGDLNQSAGLGPAYAVGKALAGGMRRSQLSGFHGISVGEEEDRRDHYMRFSQGA